MCVRGHGGGQVVYTRPQSDGLRGSEASRMGRASQGRSPSALLEEQRAVCHLWTQAGVDVSVLPLVMASWPPGAHRSWQLNPPENGLSLCQATPEVRQGALEVCSTWAMGLGSGPGEYPEGVPVEGQADRGAFVDIEGDGIGQQCDRVVELRRPPVARPGLPWNAPALPHPRAAVAA